MSHVMKALCPYLKASIEVDAGNHVYLMGLQHRRCIPEGSSRYWRPVIPSTAYVLQNEAGTREWPLYDGFAEELRGAWRGPHLHESRGGAEESP